MFKPSLQFADFRGKRVVVLIEILKEVKEAV